jgi:nicotinate-nucleotide adenylyltransferase
LGGSFNPAHEGHLHVSRIALQRLGLDRVWWLVSPQNPLKPSPRPLTERLARARAVARDKRIAVTALETDFGTHYSIDTITALQRRFPQLHFVWLMGSDNLRDFRRWKSWPAIVRRIPIAVVLRPGSTLAGLQSQALQRYPQARMRDFFTFANAKPPAIAILDGPRNAQSSSALRDRALVQAAGI